MRLWSFQELQMPGVNDVGRPRGGEFRPILVDSWNFQGLAPWLNRPLSQWKKCVLWIQYRGLSQESEYVGELNPYAIFKIRPDFNDFFHKYIYKPVKYQTDGMTES